MGRKVGLLLPLAFVQACPSGDEAPDSESIRTPVTLGPAMSVTERRQRRAALPEQEARRRARVEALLAASDPERRAEGVALMRSDHADEGARLLALLASDSSSAVRAGAASQLDLAEPEDALEPLLAALDDPAPEVVVSALRTIEMLGDASVVPRLRPYQSHPERAVRIAVASTIDVLE